MPQAIFFSRLTKQGVPFSAQRRAAFRIMTVVLVCGPTVMMKNAARLCAEKGTPCFVSMEKKMACGIGACLGCTCETKGGEGKSVCKNGPVFDATEVFF